MTQRSILVEISNSDLRYLKSGNYALCMAKKVNGIYNVVWQASTGYLQNNLLSWTSSYQVFTTASFTPGARVNIEDGPLDIALGQQAAFDTRGLVLDGSGGTAGSITFVNNIEPIRPGLSCLLQGLDSIRQSTPIFVSSLTGQNSSTLLTPTELVQVWFQQLLATGTMLGGPVPTAIEVDLTDASSATCRYQNGIWTSTIP